MVSYIVCRHFYTNLSRLDECVLPVACFSSFIEAKKSTLMQDLIDRTNSKSFKNKKWPLYCIFEVKNGLLLYNNKPSNLYNFSKSCNELYNDIEIKVMYDIYYMAQIKFIKWNNNNWEERKKDKNPSRGWAYESPELIGFEPY